MQLRRNLRIVTVAMLSAIAWVGVTVAQQAPPIVPKPGPEHKELQKLEGTWDAVMKMNGTESKATATYRPICGGKRIRIASGAFTFTPR